MMRKRERAAKGEKEFELLNQEITIEFGENVAIVSKIDSI